jgi:hypothetical protein
VGKVYFPSRAGVAKEMTFPRPITDHQSLITSSTGR